MQRRTNKEKTQWQCSMACSRSFPAKKKQSRKFAAACMGERRKGFETQLGTRDIARETWALQETPMGSFMLVWFEAPDIEKAFTQLATTEQRVHHLVPWPSQGSDRRRPGRSPEGPPPDVLVDCTP